MEMNENFNKLFTDLYQYSFKVNKKEDELLFEDGDIHFIVTEYSCECFSYKFSGYLFDCANEGVIRLDRTPKHLTTKEYLEQFIERIKKELTEYYSKNSEKHYLKG
jgi:hypothetical protein